MDNLERKFGKYAVRNLTMVLLAINAAGYVITYLLPRSGLLGLLTLNPRLILQGQIWRLVTWLVMPSRDLFSFVLVAFLFYLPIGRQLEQIWGAFRYNLYIFMGLVFTVAGAFLVYLFFVVRLGAGSAQAMTDMYAAAFTPYYVMLSIFFAFAATFPDSMVLFMFLIPLKMKWLGIGYGVMLLYTVLRGDFVTRVVIITSVLNFVVFYLMSRKSTLNRYRPSEVKRRSEFRKSVRMSPQGRTTHRCAICGVNNNDFPDMQFRYCSKCNGLYEYCSDHLFTHEHVK